MYVFHYSYISHVGKDLDERFDINEKFLRAIVIQP